MPLPPLPPSIRAGLKIAAVLGVTGYLVHFFADLSAYERTGLITLLAIHAILAMSLNMICGMTGILQLGHAGFFAIGAYAAGLIAIYGTVPALGMGNLALGAAGGMLAAALVGALIGLPCLRLRGDYLAIATLGFGEIVRLLLTMVEFPGGAMYPDETIGGATGIAFTEFPDEVFGEAYIDYSAEYSRWWLVLLVALAVYVLFRNLKRSAFGRALLCMREDEIAARAMGVNPLYYKMSAFLLSAAGAGLAGALYFHKDLTVSPGEFTLLMSIQVLLMVVLGGLGSFSGAVCAAVLLGTIPEVLRRIDLRGVEWLPSSARSIQLAEYQTMIYAVLLIALIRLAPDGLLGLRELPGFLDRRLARRAKGKETAP